VNALKYAWALTEGWEDRELAKDAEFDGHSPGGTGRFSGVLEEGMGLQSELMADGL